MTVNIDFAGWRKYCDTSGENGLLLDGYEDVGIWMEDKGELPFAADVGDFAKAFPDLASAMQWAKQLAAERDIVAGPDPLPVFNPPAPEDETLERDREFLYSRGLTKL